MGFAVERRLNDRFAVEVGKRVGAGGLEAFDKFLGSFFAGPVHFFAEDFDREEDSEAFAVERRSLVGRRRNRNGRRRREFVEDETAARKLFVVKVLRKFQRVVTVDLDAVRTDVKRQFRQDAMEIVAFLFFGLFDRLFATEKTLEEARFLGFRRVAGDR